jgi:hypothetical protein
MGLFSFVGGLLGGGSAKKASRRAEAAMVDAYNRGIGEQQRQFDTTRADFAPYLAAGTSALDGLGDLVGINGDPQQQAALDALRASPMYQSLYRNGEEALLQNGAATGGIRGGNFARSLADFGADTFASAIDRQLAQYGGLASMGLGATGSVAGFGANKASAITDLFGQIGGVKASGALTRGGINSQNWANAGSFLDDAVSSFLPGFGGFKF